MHGDGLRPAGQVEAALAGKGHRSEERVEDQQRQPAGEPAAEELADDELPAAHGLGQHGEEGAGFALSGDLPRGAGDSEDEAGHPDEGQGNFLQVAHHAGVIEDVCRCRDKREQGGEHKEHVDVLAADHLEDDQVGEGEDGFHGAVGWRSAGPASDADLEAPGQPMRRRKACSRSPSSGRLISATGPRAFNSP